VAIRIVKVAKKVCARVPNRGGPLACGDTYSEAVAEATKLLDQLDAERLASGRAPLSDLTDVTKGAGPMDPKWKTATPQYAEDADALANELAEEKAEGAGKTLGDFYSEVGKAEDDMNSWLMPSVKRRHRALVEMSQTLPPRPYEEPRPIAKMMAAAPVNLGSRLGERLVSTVCKIANLPGPDHPRYSLAEAAALGSSDKAKALYNALAKVGDVASLDELAQTNPSLAREVAGLLGGF